MGASQDHRNLKPYGDLSGIGINLLFCIVQITFTYFYLQFTIKQQYETHVCFLFMLWGSFVCIWQLSICQYQLKVKILTIHQKTRIILSCIFTISFEVTKIEWFRVIRQVLVHSTVGHSARITIWYSMNSPPTVSRSL